MNMAEIVTNCSLPTKVHVNVPLGHLVDLAMRAYAVGIGARVSSILNQC